MKKFWHVSVFKTRFIILNLIILGFFGVLTTQGWVLSVLNKDITYISHFLVVYTFYGLYNVFIKNWEEAAFTAESLVKLGLIGTITGFIIAFSGVTPDVIGNQEMIQQMILNLIPGVSVSLVTTLVGGIGNLWIFHNINSLYKYKDA